MTRLATIQLALAGSGGTGRVFLPAELIHGYSIPELEQMFAACFMDKADRRRLARIKEIALTEGEVHLSIHPGETAPPEYHVYVNDPDTPDVRLFGCVLAPEPVILQMLEDEPRPLFETVTFQGMGTDTGTDAMQVALENWMRRVWPELALPKLVLMPWPMEEVHSGLPPAPQAELPVIPKGALALLSVGDFPTEEELAG